MSAVRMNLIDHGAFAEAGANAPALPSCDATANPSDDCRDHPQKACGFPSGERTCPQPHPRKARGYGLLPHSSLVPPIKSRLVYLSEVIPFFYVYVNESVLF
jgi:1-acyl-sn-glycerol-3-phosphate acyltransferase